MRDCNICGGTLVFMGTLGHLDWYRCRHCGMEFNFEAQALKDEYFPIRGDVEAWDEEE